MYINILINMQVSIGKNRTAQQTRGQSQNSKWVTVMVCDDFSTMNVMNCAF